MFYTCTVVLLCCTVPLFCRLYTLAKYCMAQASLNFQKCCNLANQNQLKVDVVPSVNSKGGGGVTELSLL